MTRREAYDKFKTLPVEVQQAVSNAHLGWSFQMPLPYEEASWWNDDVRSDDVESGRSQVNRFLLAVVQTTV